MDIQLQSVIHAESKKLEAQNLAILDHLKCDYIELKGFTEQVAPVFKWYKVFACGEYEADFIFGVNLSQVLTPTFLNLLDANSGEVQVDFISRHVLCHLLPHNPKYRGLIAGFAHNTERLGKLHGYGLQAQEIN